MKTGNYLYDHDIEIDIEIDKKIACNIPPQGI